MINTPDNFIGGKICFFSETWRKLTHDPWILNLVNGYNIEFDTKPYQNKNPRKIHFNEQEQTIINKELLSLQSKKVIVECEPTKDEFLSNIFIRPKKDGSHRLIFNLRELNDSIEHIHFKMETLKSVLVCITKNCWFASIDLKEAYFSVRVCESDRKYLRFDWNGINFKFTCLPFGLTSAPRIFTKLLKPVFSQLRKMGHTNIAYIDDSLLVSNNFIECQKNICDTIQLLDSLGFTVHPTKSVLQPTQCITFIGFVINSIDMTIRLTEEKSSKIVLDCQKLLKRSEVTIREFAQLIGKFVASEPGVEHAALHFRALELEKSEFLKQSKGDYESKVVLSRNSKSEITWWIENIQLSFKPIIRPKPDVILESDSSNTGWGGVLRSKELKTGGHWSYSEQTLHINILELKAAFLTLKTFCSSQQHQHICIFIDNTVAVNYINKQGGRKTLLNELTKEIWNWCISRNLWLSANHIAGKNNVDADRMSRNLNSDLEWQLNPDVFKTINSIFGPLKIDLFASRLNAQLEQYVSYLPDPGASYCDAFSLSWNNEKFYAFPPFSILGQVIQKMEEDRTLQLVLVAPLWTTQPWFPKLMNCVAGNSYLLPKTNKLLIHPADPTKSHPLTKMRLAVFHLSGKPSLITMYQQKLQTLSSLHGESQPRSNIGHISQDGCYFVTKGKLIHLRHL